MITKRHNLIQNNKINYIQCIYFSIVMRIERKVVAAASVFDVNIPVARSQFSFL